MKTTRNGSEVARMVALHARFWPRVGMSAGRDGCWLWTGSTNNKGYGSLKFRGEVLKAHRVSYELTHGPITDGLCVCHRCDVPLCVAPHHLFLGTRADNNADMLAKGRGGAKLRPSQVLDVVARVQSGESRASVARTLGISVPLVGFIVTGRKWSSVTGIKQAA